uniref:Atos-like C-terminal domain-containing protein n=1 Tax=Globodera rostochiensis TaxID=31243 RepID=A0A914I968_GLORO
MALLTKYLSSMTLCQGSYVLGCQIRALLCALPLILQLLQRKDDDELTTTTNDQKRDKQTTEYRATTPFLCLNRKNKAKKEGGHGKNPIITEERKAVIICNWQMDLAKELCVEVLCDRIQQFSSPSTEYNAKLGSALADADRFLVDGVPISIHLLLCHSDCKASERELCTAAQTLEIWFFKIQGRVPYEVAARPPMLPLFLRQAIRSQLHFSPFRSWLTARKDAKPDGLFPFIRVSSSTHFAAPSDRFRCHRFPPCRVGPSLPVPSASKRIAQHRSGGEPLWLQVQVQWLKKECFLTKAPICPEMRIEPDGLWMLPASDDRCHSRTSGDVIERVDGGGEDGFASSGEDFDSLESSTPTESLSPIVRRKTKEFERDRRERMALGRRNSNKVSDERRAVEEEEKMKPTDVSKASEGQQTQRAEVFVLLRHRTLSRLRQFPLLTLDILCVQVQCHVETDELGLWIWSIWTIKLSSNRSSMFLLMADVGSESVGHSSRLRLNLQLADLIVNGFYLQLTVIDAPTEHSPSFPTTKRLTLPTAGLPSPLHLARCELEAAGIPVPKRCTLQIVLLRPCGSVVKLFMVEVDVLDMPSSSRTFIRQRIFSGGGDKETGYESRDTVSLPNAKTSSNSLRFLVHLRLASDASGQTQLHSDIRILFSNKANDLEGEYAIRGGNAANA